MLFKSKIDRLEQKQKELEASIESEKSSIAYENSRIEAKIKKLEEKAFANRTHLEKFIESKNKNFKNSFSSFDRTKETFRFSTKRRYIVS